MDTKLKSSKKSKFIINIVLGFIMLAVSLGLVASYPTIHEMSKKNNVFEGYEIQNMLSKSSYAIYSELINTREKKTVEPSSYLYKAEPYEGDITEGNGMTEEEIKKANEESRQLYELEIKNQAKDIDETIKQYADNLVNNYRNLNYYAIDKTSKTAITNAKLELKSLINETVAPSTISTLKDYYRFYAVYDYDDKGRLTVRNSYGADSTYLTNHTPEIDGRLESIKNTTIVYGIPKSIKYYDDIYNALIRQENLAYRSAANIFVLLALGIIFIVSLAVPYKKSKDLIGFKTLSKIPIEVYGFIFFVIFSMGIGIGYEIIPFTFGNVESSLIEDSNEYWGLILGLINAIYWFIVFYFVVIFITFIKHILNIGIKNYIKEKSLIYKFSGEIKSFIKKSYNYITAIDLTNKYNKKLFLIILLNAIFMMLLCSIWFFGVIGVIAYSSILFILLRKKLDKVSKSYNLLLNMTKNMRNGKLNTEINENLGVFEPFKDELLNIQKGFKKAVDEEVKSQKMKTELISNVSHDLKTPLTSIITYIDLLKDENLDEGKRKLYIGILENKSQRLQYLIEDLFEVSKAQSGNITLNIEDVDVVSLIKQTLIELEDKINSCSLQIRSSFPEDKVILPLDSQRMYRVFENLLGNITKYALEGSRVYINVEENSENVLITLKNIAKNEIDFKGEEIIERFARGDKSRNTEGSGLGLSIAKSFVDLQGGELKVVVDGDLFKVIITLNK